MVNFLTVEKLAFWYPFVLVPLRSSGCGVQPEKILGPIFG